MLLYLYPFTNDVKSMRRVEMFTIFAVLMMVGSYTINLLEIEKLENKKERKNQFGGGGSLEEQCSSITFEEMFIYDKAIFDIRINEDWETAEVEAVAWINWTNADDIREDFDEYLDADDEERNKKFNDLVLKEAAKILIDQIEFNADQSTNLFTVNSN